MNMRSLSSALLLFAATVDLPAQSLNGLCVYLEYQVVARNFAPRHWYFLPDGRYLNDAPKEELTPKGFEAPCAKYPGECGKYTIAGGKLNLTPNKGKPWVSDFKPEAGGNWNIGGIPCQKITAAYPANAKLNGRYTSGQSYGGISSASTYVFTPDGNYTVENVGSARSGISSGISATTKRGTYKLSANTLELTENGQTTRHLIYEIPAGTGTQMVIDGYSWKKN